MNLDAAGNTNGYICTTYTSLFSFYTLRLASYWIFRVNCDPYFIIYFVAFFTPNKLFIP